MDILKKKKLHRETSFLFGWVIDDIICIFVWGIPFRKEVNAMFITNKSSLCFKDTHMHTDLVFLYTHAYRFSWRDVDGDTEKHN